MDPFQGLPFNLDLLRVDEVRVHTAGALSNDSTCVVCQIRVQFESKRRLVLGLIEVALNQTAVV